MSANLKICFMGGNQAGVIGALTILAQGNTMLSAVSYSEELTAILDMLNIRTYGSVKNPGFIKCLSNSDVLISVHGKEIVSFDLLRLPKLGAINAHPFLYKYKGANPVERALKNNETKGSVGVHIMTEKVDVGRVLIEEFIDISDCNTVETVYNKLYPCYCKVILQALKIISKKGCDF